tara:strand:+ start:165 stop:632 length:468 start_codon:yes stop_codon:yes gene_type:complete
MTGYHIDLTKISIIFGLFVIALSKNNTINLSILTLLIGVVVCGNLLCLFNSKEVSKYYNVSENILYIANLFSHFIIPIFIIYILHNNINYNQLELNHILISLIINHFIIYSYFILMINKYTGHYGIKYRYVFVYGMIISLTILFSTYYLTNINNL